MSPTFVGRRTFGIVVPVILGCALSLTAAADTTSAPAHAPVPAPAPLLAAADPSAFPPPAPPADPSVLGRGVQRTMRLLATSTPRHRNHVRVLFYGQSITEQDWSKQVAADLRARFPDADLEVENRAIGGFASQLLVRSAEHDLYPFYPDLMIFHVYGANNTYEQIIRQTRARTTAEVLMQTDHATAWPDPSATPEKNKGQWWDTFMNDHFLPETAAKYGCGLVDVRAGWLAYLKANHLEPPALLKDGVHLNAHGNFLMARLVSRYLVYRPDLEPPSADRDAIREVVVGKDAQWHDGRLVVEFTGNRIDAIADPAAKPDAGPIDVRIDGRKPSAFPECYVIGRPNPGPWSPLFVMRIDHDAPLVAEDWTYRVTSVAQDGESWAFDVTGSVTGPDGGGTSKEPFVSRSRRVRIDPHDYFRGGHPPLPVGYEEKWRAWPVCCDRYSPRPPADPSKEATTVLAQGLSNAKHTLELRADDDAARAAVRALRLYKPPADAASNEAARGQ